MTKKVMQMVIKTIKANYINKFTHLDCNNKLVSAGYIYTLDSNQYFIDNDETYFKTIKKQ